MARFTRVFTLSPSYQQISASSLPLAMRLCSTASLTVLKQQRDCAQRPMPLWSTADGTVVKRRSPCGQMPARLWSIFISLHRNGMALCGGCHFRHTDKACLVFRTLAPSRTAVTRLRLTCPSCHAWQTVLSMHRNGDFNALTSSNQCIDSDVSMH